MHEISTLITFELIPQLLIDHGYLTLWKAASRARA